MEGRESAIFEYSHPDNKKTLLSQCTTWLYAPELENLVEQFGGSIPQNLEVTERLHWLVEFSQIWNFRSEQKNAEDLKTGEKARWMIDGAGINDRQVTATMSAARRLGMIECTLPNHRTYDYILVLGGARMSCFFRMKYAQILCEKHGISAKEIVGLTGMRPIADTERSSTDTYAAGADTEFDLMCAAAKSIFGVTIAEIQEEKICEDINSSWSVIKYQSRIPITVLAAPSTAPETRRANTADTYTFWAQKGRIEKGKRLLVITSQIYVPYQHMEAVRILGIPFGTSIETVGFPIEWSANQTGLQKPANYLQEIRSTLLSMEKALKEM